MSIKLTGNGRWEASRMMLPEHKETLVERSAPKPEDAPTPKVPTYEELELIRDAVLLPFMLTIVEDNSKDLLLLTSPLKKLYVMAAHVLLDHLHKELVHVNKELRARKIKVFRDDREDHDLHFRYIYRGYEDRFVITRDVAKATIGMKIAQRIRIIGSALQTGMS
ncbi:hypothetical protein [Paenibacillus puerhi]|uniref:hypothetical protein n=1 Tax=Paenibacillus puerhi TaxID=2692622 RepID=UPI001359C7D8|nr:hypothetical protein [Paenibacillus puerhi]